MKNNNLEKKIAVVGLGYVGLPLALEFSKRFTVIGFDLNEERIAELQSGKDRTNEVENDDLINAKDILFTANPLDLKESNFYIITVPTPIDDFKNPDLRPLEGASKTIGNLLKKNDIVVYESTVYPGATEEVCVPILESESGLKFNVDFFVGYSPERINPGDKKHRLPNIVKVTSGSNDTTADTVNQIYSKIIEAGTFKASSIKVAEAAKVIENTQRDVNIALINELSMIFKKMSIDTNEVLEAAGTKWNFLPFKPGLVGGHCIGVDPYYLTHKAKEIGYNPEIILAGRKLNDSMAKFVVSEIAEAQKSKGIMVAGSKALIMGFAFKENCPDYRNSKVLDMYNELTKLGVSVDVFDPWCSKKDLLTDHNIQLIDQIEKNNYQAIIIAVAHNEFKSIGIDKIKSYAKENHIIYDLKNIFDVNDADLRL